MLQVCGIDEVEHGVVLQRTVRRVHHQSAGIVPVDNLVSIVGHRGVIRVFSNGPESGSGDPGVGWRSYREGCVIVHRKDGRIHRR